MRALEVLMAAQALAENASVLWHAWGLTPEEKAHHQKWARRAYIRLSEAMGSPPVDVEAYRAWRRT